ncbi:hypothetical protein [Streptomyces wuyuanensis]|uniref:Uncharacterized protein n=1 Tax=Streptomyces wuyuanensis TaxID=1196353 RepID=A0A1H0DDF0_9ACTN|nr:hypothetical protein [Streptomyces wuyuanensis]SDN68193.1 hypothetical protein SAMN05444921_13343 [Streptomyces wuyuanensis]
MPNSASVSACPTTPRTAPTTAGQFPTGSPTPTLSSTPPPPGHWAGHLAERHRILARSLADRGHTLANFPPAWARPLGNPPPTSAPRRRHAWAATAALVELWRTRHIITGTPGLGPRPNDPNDAAAWDGLAPGCAP